MEKLAQLAVEEQPAPQYGNGEIVANDLIDWMREHDPEVSEAIIARKQIGIECYGQALQTNGGATWQRPDAYITERGAHEKILGY